MALTLLVPLPDGSDRVSGPFEIVRKDGARLEPPASPTHLCRCEWKEEA